jgi:cystathionine beta-lyase/cystathionine gamma-synthase
MEAAMSQAAIAAEVPWYRLLNRNQWSTLIAANLGWMFDGYETVAVLISVGAALRQLLEGGAACLTFASGMAAATAVFLALRPGDHVVAPQVMYWGLRNWLKSSAAERGVVVDFVDASATDALAAAVQPGRTKLIWIESPANPTWAITDIAAAAAIAHGAGARLAVDSTVATPVLTQPIELGADIVMHSATKYLNGHSDVVAGALVAARHESSGSGSRPSALAMVRSWAPSRPGGSCAACARCICAWNAAAARHR